MTSTDPLRFGIVGCGGFTRGHLALMASAPAWELVGVVDPEVGRRAEAVECIGLNPSMAFADEKTFYAETQPEVVFVHTPVAAHGQNCRNAIEAGAHVCCQKPFIHDLAEGVALAQYAREAGRIISIGQTMRMQSVTQTLARTIAKGIIGEPRFGHRMVYRNRMGKMPDYLYREKWPSIHVMGSHWIDLVRFLFNARVARVSVRGIACDWDPYDDAGAVTGWIEMEGGAVVTFQESFISHVPADPTRAPYEDNVVQGEKGAIHWTGPWGMGPVELWGGDAEKAVEIEPGGSRDPAPMTAIMDALVASVREGAPIFCPPEDNLWTMAALFAAEASAEQGGGVVDVFALAREAGLD